jgi:hypothetical protein
LRQRGLGWGEAGRGADIRLKRAEKRAGGGAEIEEAQGLVAPVAEFLERRRD